MVHNPAPAPPPLGEGFPAVPQDLLEALDRWFPAHLPVDAAVLDADAGRIHVGLARVQGRRDVIDFLRAARAASHRGSSVAPSSGDSVKVAL